jgi:adenine deaminase
MATLNTAEWFGLHDRGAIAPGRLADLVLFEDLAKPTARIVYVGGRRVDQEARMAALAPRANIPPALTKSVHVVPDQLDFALLARPGQIRVIECTPDQLVTPHRVETPRIVDGRVVADVERDILKMVVVGRHTGSGRTGVGFIRGFGLKSGAIAGTVAHDHHNVIVIGCDDASMTAAARAVADMGGGLAVADRAALVAGLPLPVAGLMSDQDIQFVSVTYARLLDAARGLGSTLRDPFMAMSFMALEVIPSLKLTDKGLVYVEAFRHVDLFV